MRRVFLSYAKSARAEVDVIAEDLAGLDLAVWYDHSLEGGQHWWDEILVQVRECDCFMFCLSADALDSDACVLELEYALALERPLLPVLLVDDVETSLLPESLATIQYVDYTQADKKALTALTRALGKLEEAPPLPDPLPALPEVPVSELGRLRVRVRTEGSLDEQAQMQLVLELKGRLRDPRDASGARMLLEELRGRRDLLAYLATEIDEELGKRFPAQREDPPPKAQLRQAAPRTEAERRPTSPLDPHQAEVERDGRTMRWVGEAEVPADRLMQVATDAVATLGWDVQSSTNHTLRVKVGLNLTSWGEILEVDVRTLGPTMTRLHVSCRPSMPLQVMDWGKSSRNVRTLLEHMAAATR